MNTLFINSIRSIVRLMVEGMTPEQFEVMSRPGALQDLDITIVVGVRHYGDYSKDAHGFVVGEGYLYSDIFGEEVIFN